jgi:hypothetical protein
MSLLNQREFLRDELSLIIELLQGSEPVYLFKQIKNGRTDLENILEEIEGNRENGNTQSLKEQLEDKSSTPIFVIEINLVEVVYSERNESKDIKRLVSNMIYDIWLQKNQNKPTQIPIIRRDLKATN